jgi:hypothetical protein
MSTHTAAGDVDHMLASTAFTHLSETITDCMDAGIFRRGDPLPVALRLWSAAHGIASLLITKPFLPWGDVLDVANRVLGAAATGLAIFDYLGEPTPTRFTDWLTGLPPGPRPADTERQLPGQ